MSNLQTRTDYKTSEQKKEGSSITLNFFMNVLLSLSSILFPLITHPYISRILGPDGLGRVSFATSLISYFSMFAQLGIPTYGIRVCAKARDNKEELTKTVQELLLLNLITNAITYAALAMALLFVPSLREDRTLYVIMSSTILLTSIGMEWIYKGLEKYTFITIRSVICKLIALAAMFLLVKSESDYVIYGVISIFAASASNVLNLINVRKYIFLKRQKGLNPFRHLKAVLIFFAMSCAIVVYTNLDTVMLGFMKTKTDVGYYNSALKIKFLLVSVVTSLGTVLLPRASYYIEKKQFEEFYAIGKKALNFVFVFSIPLMIYFILFARESILILSGEDFIPAILPMQVIMPTLLLIGITNILGIQMLVPLGKEKIVLYSEIAGAVVDLILNLILIPRYASTGAAIGTLAAELAVFVVQAIALRKTFMEALKQISHWKIICGLLIAVPACIWVKWTGLGNILCMVISFILFALVYAAFLLLTKESFVMMLFEKIKAKLH